MAEKIRGKDTIVILSDSYLNKFRVSHNGVNGMLDISPHATSKGNNCVEVINLASGGQTFSKIEKEEIVLTRWIESAPIITLIHIGACDIINKDIDLNKGKESLGNFFYNILINFIVIE